MRPAAPTDPEREAQYWQRLLSKRKVTLRKIATARANMLHHQRKYQQHKRYLSLLLEEFTEAVLDEEAAEPKADPLDDGDF